MHRRGAIATALVFVLACSDPPAPRAPGARPSPSRREPGGASGFVPALMPLPPRAASRCAATAAIAAICPTEVPEIEGRAFLALQGARRLFSAEWGGPYPGIGRRNGPPRFAHLVVQTGEVATMLPFEIPTQVAVELNLSRKRKGALLLGRPPWTNPPGSLILAPPFPRGGINGDHLVYLWRGDGVANVVSLHAWLPLREATETLRAVVESIAR